MLFAAEWGDLSQLLTISLVGRYHDALSVFIGAWAALLAVSGLAVRRGPVPAAAHAAVDDPLRRRRGLLPARRPDGVPDRHGVTPGASAPRVRAMSTTPPPATAPRTVPTPRSAGSAPSCSTGPGPELKRLTPRNNDRLLFDGIPWVARAQDEHDAFAAALRERGVEVLYLIDLLTETLASAGGARAARSPPRSSSLHLGDTMRAWLGPMLHEASPAELASHLTAGVRNDEVRGGFGLVT